MRGLRWNSPVLVRGHGFRIVFLVGLMAILGSLQGSEGVGQGIAEPLSDLQQKIVAAAAKAQPSVVRVVWRHDDWDDSASGVIFTADGYVATYLYMSFRAPQSRYDPHLPPGQAVSVHLADGRTVSGVAVGSFSSAVNLSFDLVKITEPGVWPCAEIGRADQAKPGDPCLALGYLRSPDGLTRDPAPSAHLGHLIPWGAAGMLRSSCLVEGLDDRGGGLFDLEGRLIGLHHGTPFSDYETRTGRTTCHLDIQIVEQNWRRLVDQGNVAKESTGDCPAPLSEGPQDDALPAVPSLESPELAAVAAKVREATVALATFPREPLLGCSGTIITPNGFIATCAHHQMARGTATTAYFADGRTAEAEILGRDDVLDVGLAKLKGPGPWPSIAIQEVADVKVADPCMVAGYPNRLRRNGKVPFVVRGARIADLQYAPAERLVLAEISDGDSGGGVFDAQGRLLGVCSGQATPRKVFAFAGVEGFRVVWDSLVTGPALGDPVPFDASSLAQSVCQAVERVPAIVCEVLGDNQRRALGTIVSSSGDVLTKASELYGELSCRLSDGRVLPAVVRSVVREHDLALLKIDAANLPQIVWSPRPEIPVGTFVAALKMGEPSSVGIVSYATHEVAPATGYLGIGEVKNADGGIRVEQLRSWWEPRMVQEVRRSKGLADYESPIHEGDIILGIEGHTVPDAETFERLTTPMAHNRGRKVELAIAGDPIQVVVRRGGKELKLRFPLLSTGWDLRDKTSPRSGSFPSVFDTDVRLSRDTCGGPLVDCEGRVVGIAIALPTAVVMESPVMSRVFVIPATVARAVAEKR